MLQKFNPESTYPSFTVYSQGVQVPPGARWLYTSGQVGVNPDGSLAGDSEAQFESPTLQYQWDSLQTVLMILRNNGNILVFAPALIITAEQIAWFVDRIDEALSAAAQHFGV